MTHTTLRFLPACLSVLLFLGCQDLGDIEGSGDWALYQLGDSTLTGKDVRGQAITTLALAPAPFITARDVKAYHWKTHEIELTWQAEALMDTLALRRGSTFGVPFVVSVGTERIYIGTFWWAYSSLMPWCPYIETIFPYSSLPPQPYRIELPPLYQGSDPRADKRVYWSLKKAGVLVEE